MVSDVCFVEFLWFVLSFWVSGDIVLLVFLLYFLFCVFNVRIWCLRLVLLSFCGLFWLFGVSGYSVFFPFWFVVFMCTKVRICMFLLCSSVLIGYQSISLASYNRNQSLLHVFLRRWRRRWSSESPSWPLSSMQCYQNDSSGTTFPTPTSTPPRLSAWPSPYSGLSSSASTTRWPTRCGCLSSSPLSSSLLFLCRWVGGGWVRLLELAIEVFGFLWLCLSWYCLLLQYLNFSFARMY